MCSLIILCGVIDISVSAFSGFSSTPTDTVGKQDTPEREVRSEASQGKSRSVVCYIFILWIDGIVIYEMVVLI